jgi:hypothetical protein
MKSRAKSYSIFIPDIDVPFCHINEDIQRHINYGLELISFIGAGQNGDSNQAGPFRWIKKRNNGLKAVTFQFMTFMSLFAI